MKVKPHLYQIISLTALFMLLFLHGCNDDQEYIPYVPVNFSVNLTIMNELTTTGYSRLFEAEGYGGVIVFCEFYDVVTPSASIYHAYDATCTNEISKDCTLSSENNNVTALCSCCSSEYSLFDGFPYKGDATVALKTYNVSIVSNKLQIYN